MKKIWWMMAVMGVVSGVIASEPAPTNRALKEMVLDLGNDVSLKLVLVPAGKFLMGDPDPKSKSDAQHEVTITKSFYMGIYEVTQAQYEQIMGKNPTQKDNPGNVGTNKPVTMQTWPEAVEFCKKASEKTGKTVRLPTEAEWEYAARAGTTTKRPHGDDSEEYLDYVWGPGNAGGHVIHEVGQLKPNPWGLYDTMGNVWEMTADWWAPYPSEPVTDPQGPKEPAKYQGRSIIHVSRGGSFYAGAPEILGRYGYADDFPKRHIGFRVVVNEE